jgi:hypothetical protein
MSNIAGFFSRIAFRIAPSSAKYQRHHKQYLISPGQEWLKHRIPVRPQRFAPLHGFCTLHSFAELGESFEASRFQGSSQAPVVNTTPKFKTYHQAW